MNRVNNRLLVFMMLLTGCQAPVKESFSMKGEHIRSELIAAHCKMEELQEQSAQLWDSLEVERSASLPASKPVDERRNMLQVRNAELIRMFQVFPRLPEPVRLAVERAVQKNQELAAYECVQPGMDNQHNSLQGYYPGLTIPEPQVGQSYHWALALTATYERMFELLMPEAPAEHLFKIYDLRTEYFLRFQREVSTKVYRRSIQYDTEVAEAVYAWSATDEAGHEAFRRNADPEYNPPAGPGLWQPTFPDFLPALLPHWEEVRMFAADGTEVCEPPHAYSTDPGSTIYQEAVEVMEQSVPGEAMRCFSENNYEVA